VSLNHHRTGSGEPLVLVHGIGSQWQVWQPLFPHLAPHREVIAVDLPGFGESPALPDGVEPTPQALADAVVELLDDLGLERPVVGGNSLGGWISLELGRRGRARACGPIDPAGFQLPRERLYSTTRLRIEYSAARLVLRSGVARAMVRNPLTRAPFFSPMMTKPWRLSAEDAERTVRNLASSPGFLATLEVLGRATFAAGHEVRVPVTLMWGTHDFLLLPRQAHRALRVLPSARLHWLKRSGHVPTWDAPEEIARELLAL
jgi:pimeloyl-ACP methyl ester carboxylesterase